MQEMMKQQNDKKYIDGGSFKMKVGKKLFEVVIYFNGEKKITAEDRIKKLISQDVKAGNF